MAIVKTESMPTPAALLIAAQERTGLSDFGDEAFREGFELLADEVDALGLAQDSVQTSLHYINTFLDARLLAVAGWKASPSCLAAKIERPLIIAGLVRSGTTALHLLLSLDEQFQVPEHWLAVSPMPRPPRSEWANVPAYQAVAQRVSALIDATPELAADHMMSAEGAEESIYIQAQTFASNFFASAWDIPNYDRWYRRRDETDSYEWLANVLRLIGSGSGQGRWLLKNPTDLFALDAMLNVFPDAMVVQTHRDPVEAIPSICTLLGAGRRSFMGDRADLTALGRRESDFWAVALQRADRARRRAPRQFFDVEFNAFVSNQMETVRRIYDCFGLELTAKTEAAMRAWLAKHPRRPSGGSRYTPETYGLSAEGLMELYRPYRQRRGYV
jgi:hypothetical protein